MGVSERGGGGGQNTPMHLQSQFSDRSVDCVSVCVTNVKKKKKHKVAFKTFTQL